MEVYKKLEELQRECAQLGLVVSGTGKKDRVLRNDYALALQRYNLHKRYGEFIPESVIKRLNIPNLMLCFRFNDLDADSKLGVWRSADWIAEEKIDGVRAVLVYDGVSGLKFYAREPNGNTFLYDEYKVVNGLNTSALSLSSFILDIEMVCKSEKLFQMMQGYGQINSALEALMLLLNNPDTEIMQKNGLALSFYGLHLLEMNGVYYDKTSYRNMRPVLEQIVLMLKGAGLDINVLKIVGGSEDKTLFFDSLVAERKEGVILKHIEAPYNMTGSRYHKQWIKVKHVVQNGLTSIEGGEVSEFTGYITGYVPVDISSGGRFLKEFQVSTNVVFPDGHSEVVKMADVPIEEMSLKLDMSCIGPRGIFLKETYYNRVVEFTGSFSHNTMSVRNPKFLRFRDDIDKFACVIKKEF